MMMVRTGVSSTFVLAFETEKVSRSKIRSRTAGERSRKAASPVALPASRRLPGPRQATRGRQGGQTEHISSGSFPEARLQDLLHRVAAGFPGLAAAVPRVVDLLGSSDVSGLGGLGLFREAEPVLHLREER